VIRTLAVWRAGGGIASHRNLGKRSHTPSPGPMVLSHNYGQSGRRDLPLIILIYV
jgi:hypothetical protein